MQKFSNTTIGFILCISFLLVGGFLNNSWANSFQQQVNTIYKKYPQKEQLYARMVEIQSLLNDADSAVLLKTIAQNSRKLTKNSESYHLYRIVSIQKMWSNGYIKEAYKLSEELLWDKALMKEKVLLPYLYSAVSNLYYTVSNDYLIAKKYYIKSLFVQKDLKDTIGYQSSCINIAQMCFQIHQFEEGDRYLQKAKSFEKYGYIQFRPYLITCELSSLMLQNKNMEARNFMAENKEIIMNMSPALYHVNLGMIELDLNHEKQAEEHLLAAFDLARKVKNTDFFLKSVTHLSRLYDHQHKLELAYKFGKIKDSIVETITERSVKNTIDSLQLVNAQKTTEMETRNSRIQLNQSKQTQLSLFIGLMICLIVLLVVTVFLLRIRKKNIALVRTGMSATLTFDKEIISLNNTFNDSVNKEKNRALNTLLSQEINDFLIEKKKFVLKEISLQYLAKKLKSNQHDISETINLYYGLTLPNLLNKLRIHEAMKLLVDESYRHYSIEGISQEVGYESISTFNRNFKEIAGVPPSFYQKEALKIAKMNLDTELLKERA